MTYLFPGFALGRFGHGSVAFGVTVGPFKITLQSLIAASTSSGTVCILAQRFLMVKPSIF